MGKNYAIAAIITMVIGSGYILYSSDLINYKSATPAQSVVTPEVIPETATSSGTTNTTKVAKDNPSSPTEPIVNPVLTGNVTGFYVEYSMDWWKEEYGTDIDSCTAFEITSGDQAVINKYKQFVKDGNTIQHLSGQGNLVMNLPWENLSESAQATIKASTSSAPLTLHLTEKPSTGTHLGGPCYSWFIVSPVATTLKDVTVADKLDTGSAPVSLSDIEHDVSITYKLVDLNADGQNEVMTMIAGDQCTSRAGCKFGIYRIIDGHIGERLTSVNTSSIFPEITTTKTKGYFNLSFGLSGLGQDGILKWNGTEYSI